MASRFVLTAQVQLQAPSNARQVVNQIQQQLKGINVNVNLQGGQQASKQINNLNKATKQATTQAGKMGKAFGASIRRFGAFTIATRAVSLFTNSLANAVKEAIDFEREMIKISQVTGKTVGQLKELENTITSLSTSLGVSSKSILSVGRILAQAGIQAGDLKVALTALAKTELAPTFDDITKTAEGAVAILAQFGEGVGALERQLGAINRVAGQFAVESGDLISAVRRTGGVFKAAGGELEELLALFTSVRATTRESAESIATGLRTIFTRIQRPKTIEFLKQFGVELTDLNGKFVGPFEAIRQLSSALSGLGEGDIQFVRIAEELGGFRQIGKVIPLLQQFEVAEKARQAALEGGNSLNQDAAKAQAALAVQITKVKEEFLALVRSISQSTSFQLFAKTSLELASALIKIADALKPLIPLLTAFAAIKLTKGVAGFARGIGAGIRGGGSPTGFARGGVVPGTGNRDTVPAMLTPGEFVIRKSSVESLGADTLAQMNENKFAPGGKVDPLKVKRELDKKRGSQVFDFKKGATIQAGKGGSGTLKAAIGQAEALADLDSYQAVFLRPEARDKQFLGQISKPNLKTAVSEAIKGTNIPKTKLGTANQIAERYASRNKFSLTAGSLTAQESEKLETSLIQGVYETAQTAARGINKTLGIQGEENIASALRSANIDQVLGNLFEVVLSSAGAPFGMPDTDPPNAPFDFPRGLGSVSGKFNLKAGIPTEAKSFFSEDNLSTINKKVQNQLINESIDELRSVYRNFLVEDPEAPSSLSLDQAKRAFGSTKLTTSDVSLLAESQGLSFTKEAAGQYSLKPKSAKRRNAGGGISGSDTVPAMLTPGEFVFNKKAAQSIGYSNLSKMNKQGIKGYAAGGVVTSDRHFYGISSDGRSTTDIFNMAEMEVVAKEQKDATLKQIKSQTEQIKQQKAIEKVTKESTKSRKSLIKRMTSLFKGKNFAAKRAMVEAGQSGKLTRAARKNDGGSRGGFSGRGLVLTSAAASIGAFIPQVEGATEGLGAMQNVAGEAITQFSALAGLGLEFGKLGGAVGIVAGAFLATTKLLDAYNGVTEKAQKAEEKAIETGKESDIAAAQSAAVNASNQAAITKAGAALTTGLTAAGFALGGPFGAAIGGAVGVLGTLAAKSGLLESIFGVTGDQVQNFFAILGQGPSVNQTKAQTKFSIASARATKQLADAAKDASEELKEIEAGKLSATASLGKGGAAATAAGALLDKGDAANSLIAANNQQTQAFDAIKNSLQSQGTLGGQIAGGLYGMLTSGQRAANEQQNKQLRQQQIKDQQSFIAGQSGRFAMATTEQVTTAAASGGTATFNDFFRSLDPNIQAIIKQTDKMNGNTDEMDRLKKNFENQSKAVLENIKFVKAMNFGLSDVTSGITAYSNSLNNLVASQETGFSTAAVAASTLSTAISSAGANISSSELDKSLGFLEQNLEKFGANTSQIDNAKNLITGLNDVQKNAASALAAVKDGFKGGGAGPEEIKNKLRDTILSSVPDGSPIRQKLLDSFGNMEIPPEAIQNFLNTGDVSGILNEAFGPIEESVRKQLIGPLEEIQKQEEALVALTKQRRAAEEKLIQVQQQAIDAQIEAAKTFEEFGGSKFTPEQEFAARRQQANLTLQDAGVAGLTTGSADDIRRASEEVLTRFSAQQGAQNAAAIQGGGAFGGVEGVQQDRREELKNANQALIEITKRGIEQRKQELELIQKKNQAEKQALDSLLGGDVESFIDQSISAAAGSALRSGDAQAASLFSAGALGQGLKGLQGTGLTDAENQRAAQIAFGSFGLGGDAANVFAGTTTEEERIKAEGRDLALLQGELAQQSTELEQMTVDAQTVVITAANLDLQRISDQVQQQQAIAGFSKGGMIYASKGMFVPRGTDTVPAMLTPGEFVVNRAAVQRGNNLQILRSMNSNSGSSQNTQALSRGGPVRYRAAGSTGPEIPSSYSSMDFSKFEELVNKFQEVIGSLPREISMKLADVNANMNINGLQGINDMVKNEVSNKLGNLLVTDNGKVADRSSVLDSMV